MQARGRSLMRLADVSVAILAGGRATRLGQLSADLPKSLVPVAGRPFVEHQLELLHEKGVRQIVMCVGHLGDQIVQHVGDGTRFGVEVRYSFDGDRLLGTGGALRRALPLLGRLCLVTYGDSYLDIDYGEFLDHFEAQSAPAMMTVFRNDGRWDQSNVHFANGHVVRYDKRQPDPAMAYIDYGASIFLATVVESIPPETSIDLGDLTHALAAERKLAGFEVSQRFYEVGSRSGIEETERYLIERRASAGTQPRSSSPGQDL
jgi:NDP-sugar pyrophosphorylase family protein